MAEGNNAKLIDVENQKALFSNAVASVERLLKLRDQG